MGKGTTVLVSRSRVRFTSLMAGLLCLAAAEAGAQTNGEEAPEPAPTPSSNESMGEEADGGGAAAAAPELRVETTPAGAALFVDGRRLGDTPFRGPLAPGFHELRLVAEGWEPHVRFVQVPAEGEVHVQVRLSPAHRAGLVVRSESAEIFLNGELLGVGEVRRDDLPAGPALIEIKRPGHRTHLQSVDLEDGETIVIETALLPEPARLVVTADAPLATVSVDDESLGPAPVVADLPPGSRHLRVSAPGHTTFELQLHLFSGQTREVDATLAPSAPSGEESSDDSSGGSGRQVRWIPRDHHRVVGLGTGLGLDATRGHAAVLLVLRNALGPVAAYGSIGWRKAPILDGEAKHVSFGAELTLRLLERWWSETRSLETELGVSCELPIRAASQPDLEPRLGPVAGLLLRFGGFVTRLSYRIDLVDNIFPDHELRLTIGWRP